ncbi:EVE domain-containing protein [Brumimicrobium oceani]|uniref:EVE domain-containing protein n=1 Tax=Brumimicrobium oceani TaxID=2100725 RepID=A0A2U2XEP7_9FLAO|nr:EVE domain-containing protein [Brumimicrobium oceani]PWH86278.1 hypothetical protein DIT68_03300 [Brumimicrobium oceani]
MHFHQTIHKLLLSYREKHNQNFNFLVRQRASTNDKKYPGGKFAHGMVFQGTDDYCFVALSDKSGGANSTKSIGIVIRPLQNNTYSAHFEIVFPGIEDPEIIAFYKELATKFTEIKWDKKGERAWLHIGEFSEDSPTLLYNWLDENYPILKESALKSGIDDILPNDERFEQLQDNLAKRLKSDKKPINYWIFQGNSKIYNITKALKAGHLKSWKVAAHKEKIKVGDQIIVWQTGNRAGCYALAEVTSEVGTFEEEEYEQQYYINSEETPPTHRVKIIITKYLADDPILWEEIKNNPLFSSFNGGTQGTNFSATEKEFKALLGMTKTTDINYWIYSPGRNAEHWNSFYEEGIMAIGWDELGDLSQYETRDDIYSALQENYGGEGSKKNNVTANFEFSREIKIGDVVIVKKGRNELLGYGIVTSDYFHNNSKKTYKSSRSVDWKINGSWKTNRSLVLKTLTNITNYKSDDDDYEFFYQRLMGLMQGDEKQIEIMQKLKLPTNQILFGPPGTGKTYFLKEQLFDQYTLKETSISHEKYSEKIVSDLTWWQVTTLALLEIGTASVNEILENRWVAKKASLSESKNVRATLWGTLQIHTIAESKNVAYTQRTAPFIFDKTQEKTWKLLSTELDEQAPELREIKDSVDNYNPDPDKIIKNYDFVTFHQSFAYEDFIEGIKPILPENEAEESIDLGYKIEDGVFKKLCLKAKNDPNNRYAIFIDEINRGNVSAIFGELITLIEIDKRTGAKNELSIKLPYSKELFSVPSNIDIYGTMNTADRSVEALDTALRRRFSFKEMMPNPELLSDIDIEGINLAELLTTINERIEVLVDRDHTIGHSYFLNVESKEDLKNVFMDKVIPLLQEYFFGDYSKMELVIGSYFFKKELPKVTFAVNNQEYYEERKRYVFKDFDSSDFDIITALKALLLITEEAS